MEWSVVIPTKGRPGKLAACIAALTGQVGTEGTPGFEVIVGVDGPDQGEGAACEAVRGGLDLKVVASQPKRGGALGPAAARNRALEVARGRMLLLLNDDVVPAGDVLARHAAARAGVPDRTMVLGAAPFRVEADDRLFDRLIRETSMIFFYDQMVPSKVGGVGAAGMDDPVFRDRDWGYRHAWTLNLSVELEAVRTVGGFATTLPGAAFEDVELGWRLRERFGSAVVYRPEAVVEHDHRYEPAGYLQRERMLGRDAWALARANEACARDLFGRDVRSADEVEYSRAFVEREATTAGRLEKAFVGLAEIPAGAVGGERAGEILNLVYGQHVLLKRWWWRVGLLEAAGERVEKVKGGPRAGW